MILKQFEDSRALTAAIESITDGKKEYWDEFLKQPGSISFLCYCSPESPIYRRFLKIIEEKEQMNLSLSKPELEQILINLWDQYTQYVVPELINNLKRVFTEELYRDVILKIKKGTKFKTTMRKKIAQANRKYTDITSISELADVDVSQYSEAARGCLLI